MNKIHNQLSDIRKNLEQLDGKDQLELTSIADGMAAIAHTFRATVGSNLLLDDSQLMGFGGALDVMSQALFRRSEKEFDLLGDSLKVLDEVSSHLKEVSDA